MQIEVVVKSNDLDISAANGHRVATQVRTTARGRTNNIAKGISLVPPVKYFVPAEPRRTERRLDLSTDESDPGDTTTVHAPQSYFSGKARQCTDYQSSQSTASFVETAAERGRKDHAKGPREDKIAASIDLDLSRLFSQVNVIMCERPGHPGPNDPGHEPDIEECRAYIMERLRNLEVSWGAPWQMKSICRVD